MVARHDQATDPAAGGSTRGVKATGTTADVAPSPMVLLRQRR
jgi:hypothetical protein